ncbi:MAG: hypothetical protein IKQ41_04790 [Clostridia bacterium]|nr:hypothetical protein [Clostridia bacterium]
MTPRIVTIDAGTTSVKVCLFSADMRLEKKSIQEYPLRKSGVWVEADAETYLRAIARGMRAIGARDADVAAVGLTTQGETMTVTDADGVPQIPFLVWLDQRAGEQAEKLRALFPDDPFYRETGLPGITGAMPLTKALWLKEKRPGLFSPGCRVLLLEDYLLRFMTGRFLTEKTLQTSTGWFSLRRDAVWPEALAAAGLTTAMLPEVTDSGVQAGVLGPQAADSLGLPSGIPVFTGAMDQVSAAYAMGRFFPGAVMETTGTALVAAASVRGLSLMEKAGFPHTTLYRHVNEGDYLLLPIGNTGGMALTWFRDAFCRDLNGDYAAMNRLAESAPTGAEGVLFLPFLDGSVDPDACPQARGVFFGLSLTSERSHCVRAVMEGVAHLLRDMLKIMERCGANAGQVCSLGGGGRSPVWEQIKADICEKTFVTLDCEEAASLGAALLAARGAGIEESGACVRPRITARYAPDPAVAGLYRDAHEKYTNLYQAVRPLF